MTEQMFYPYRKDTTSWAEYQKELEDFFDELWEEDQALSARRKHDRHNEIVKGAPDSLDAWEYWHPSTVDTDIQEDFWPEEKEHSGGSNDIYKIPEDVNDVLDIIEFLGLNFAEGNILKAIYRIGRKPNTSKKYDLEKIKFFAERELGRIRDDV